MTERKRYEAANIDGRWYVLFWTERNDKLSYLSVYVETGSEIKAAHLCRLLNEAHQA